MKLLKHHYNKGLGGILLDDIQESLPHFEKTIKQRSNDIIFITRPTDKKKVAFYHDREMDYTVSAVLTIFGALMHMLHYLNRKKYLKSM